MSLNMEQDDRLLSDNSSYDSLLSSNTSISSDGLSRIVIEVVDVEMPMVNDELNFNCVVLLDRIDLSQWGLDSRLLTNDYFNNLAEGVEQLSWFDHSVDDIDSLFSDVDFGVDNLQLLLNGIDYEIEFLTDCLLDFKDYLCDWELAGINVDDFFYDF
ncbi:unnamed protein product [Rotaria sordida]|uniref:Uncharacterized protein n=1 Tax=Rotaria sordida TaxID=392033 RepID=A0A818W0Z3_9BILA|nr:unnamed protein product [Rotaria sordida]CAF3718807.1 unnamed protein product [Rotaria sordida]